MKQLKQLLKESFLMNIVYKYRMVRFKHYWKKEILIIKLRLIAYFLQK